MSIMIVQFLHSGKEYKLSKTEKEENLKLWNCEKTHRRKYLHAKGTYIEDGKETKGNKIYFWGEWEPQSKVTPIENQEQGAFPHYIHEPFVEIKSGHLVVPINKEDKDAHPVNTDPFVFGEDGFYYSCCMQSHYETLQKLKPGSIILFGSNINHRKKSDSNINQENKPKPYFALDTVFVVGDDIYEENEENEEKPYKQSYTIKSYAEKLKKVPNHYLDIMNFKGWKESLKSTNNGIKLSGCYGANCTSNKGESEGCEKGSAFTCYRGASYKNKVNGMYSFVPCKIGAEGEKGFERVKLTEDSFKDIFEGIISNNLSQGVKNTETNLDVNIAIWNELCKIIKSQGFKKAVRLDYK